MQMVRRWGFSSGCMLMILSPWILQQLPAMASSSQWKIDSGHSTVRFLTKTGPRIRAKGTFTNVSGQLVYDAAAPAKASVTARIPLATMTTGSKGRDDDLKSPKYFDVSKFPAATFTARRLVKRADGRYRLRGKLTLHGVSKPVTVTTKGPKIRTEKNGHSTLMVDGTAVIDQKDFGLTLLKLHPDGAVKVNKAIAITINLQATRKKVSQPGGPASKSMSTSRNKPHR